MRVGGQRHDPADLLPEKKPGIHCIRSWVGVRVELDESGKSRPHRNLKPRTLHPVAFRYTGYAAPAASAFSTYLTPIILDEFLSEKYAAFIFYREDGEMFL
jgi:hypothetical protein